MNSFIQFLLVISFICYDGIDPSPQKKLTKKQKGIIESLVSFADSLNGKTKSSSIILTKIATLKNDNVEFMPFYHLDIDKFYKDPTPEILVSTGHSCHAFTTRKSRYIIPVNCPKTKFPLDT